MTLKAENLKKRMMLWFVMVVIFAVWIYRPQLSDEQQAANSTLNTDKTSVYPSKSHNNVKDKTIASAWQWDKFSSANLSIPEEHALSKDLSINGNEENSVAGDRQFDLKFIYQSLEAVRLDDEGDILLDAQALASLDQVLKMGNLKLSQEELTSLQEIIRTGLPGSAGEQTATLVENYYQYLGAEQEFNTLYESNLNSQSEAENSHQQLAKAEIQFDELLALRQVYLGDNAAGKLFSVADANARYMFDSQKLALDLGLSESQRKQKQAEIIEQHTASTIGISNWQERYVEFLQSKKRIVTASLSDEEKQQQISNLLTQSFSSAELEKVSYLQLASF